MTPEQLEERKKQAVAAFLKAREDYWAGRELPPRVRERMEAYAQHVKQHGDRNNVQTFGMALFFVYGPNLDQEEIEEDWTWNAAEAEKYGVTKIKPLYTKAEVDAALKEAVGAFVKYRRMAMNEQAHELPEKVRPVLAKYVADVKENGDSFRAQANCLAEFYKCGEKIERPYFGGLPSFMWDKEKANLWGVKMLDITPAKHIRARQQQEYEERQRRQSAQQHQQYVHQRKQQLEKQTTNFGLIVGVVLVLGLIFIASGVWH